MEKKAHKPSRIKGFIKKHRLVTALIAVISAAAIGVGGFAVANQKDSGGAYSFVRTTTLTKGTLEDTVTATGTVSSAATSKVTTTLNYTVKSIAVSVGDAVKKGDVIITLDTEELEEQIAKEQSNLAKTKSSASTAYNSAETAYSEAKQKYSDYADTLSEAKSAYNTAKTPYNKALGSISSYQKAYDSALDSYNSAGAKYVSAQSAYTKALKKYKSGSLSKSKLLSAASDYLKAIQNCYGGCTVGSYDISDSASTAVSGGAMNGGDSAASSDTVNVSQSADALCSAVVNEVKAATGTRLSVPSGSNALYKLSQKAAALRSAKESCNYASLESAYESAKSAYEAAKQTSEQYQNELKQAKEQLDKAAEEVENASSNDALEELQSQLKECTLTAEQDGTVTAINASVGSACNMEAAATIQDLSSLQVDITVEEADINSIKLGMTCRITSDASDEILSGTLTQLDPVSENGSFGATVTVETDSTSLYIGMNANVDIIVSSEEAVYQVPLDAVGEENGNSFVYRQTGGSGTDMEFEKVSVTTGESNDYYIEISSDSLSEGDVIRSSADLTQGIETVSDSENAESKSGGLFSSLFGGLGNNERNGNMGGGPDGNRSNNSNSGDFGGGGAPPSGGMPGGGND